MAFWKRGVAKDFINRICGKNEVVFDFFISLIKSSLSEKPVEKIDNLPSI